MFRRILQFVGLSLLIIVGTLEIGARLVLPDDIRTALAPENDRHYIFHARYGWLPAPGAFGEIRTGSREIAYQNNSLGFRDREHEKNSRPKVLLLGDSFVWGYEVEQNARVSERLAELRPDLEFVNLGVSGFGTDQEFLVLQDFFERYDPKAVVLIFNPRNDRADNSTNLRYGPYYKPYFVSSGGSVVLSGVPVPYSLAFRVMKLPILRASVSLQLLFRSFYQLVHPEQVTVEDPTLGILTEMNKFLALHGSRFVLAVTDADQELMQFTAQNSIPYLDLSTEHRFQSSGNHWTEAGHREAASKIFALLSPAELNIH